MSESVPAIGRPTKYSVEIKNQIVKLLELGLTIAQIADSIDVNIDTIYEWGKKHPAFSEAIKNARKNFDEEVEKSLLHRAKGYSHPDVDIKVVNGEIVKTEIVKHYPPSEVACIFWLKNRQPDRWRDVQRSEILLAKVEVSGSSAKEIEEELRKRAITLPE